MAPVVFQDTEESSGNYFCSHCSSTFSEYDYRSATAIYANNVADLMSELGLVIDHGCCGCVYLEPGRSAAVISDELGSSEDVWYCGNGCFHHDDGSGPEIDYSANGEWICDDCGNSYLVSNYSSSESAKADALKCC